MATKQEQFQELADQLMGLVGGKENVRLVTHCMTRLRLDVVDKDKVDVKAIEAFSCVIGSKWAANQIQIIIGQSVPDLYALVAEKTGLGAGSVDDDVAAAEDGVKGKDKFSFVKLVEILSGCITPNLPILIGAGMIKVFVTIFNLLGVLPADSNTYAILNSLGEAGFYYLPIFIGYSAARKLGASPLLGALMGAFLVHPTISELILSGESVTFFGIPVIPALYTSSVFPIILTVAVMAPVERFIAKHSPESIRVMTEPVFTLLVMAPLALCVLGPLGSIFGAALSSGMVWLYEHIGFIAIAAMAALWPLLVMTGMHTAFVPYAINVFAATGVEPFLTPGAVVASLNQAAASLAVALKTKDKSLKATGFSCFVTALFSGVFEPALFGITLKYRTPLYAAMIGGVVGGAIMGFGRAAAYSGAGTTGLLAVPAFVSPDGMSNLIWALAGIAAGFVTTFIITLVTYKDEAAE